MKKAIAAILATAGIAGSLALAPTAQAAPSCTDSVLLAVPGTWESESGASTKPNGMLQALSDEMEKMNPGKTAFVFVDYPAAVGGLAAPVTGTKAPFAESVREGIDNTIRYAKEYKSRCPGIKIGLTGFSQGALVAGDVAELVGNGRVDGLSADDFAGAVMYADPRRAPSHDGRREVKRDGSEQSIGPAGAPLRGEGIFGYRKDYGRMTNKTVSICGENDAFCNLPLDARPTGDWVAAVAEYNTGSNAAQLSRMVDAGLAEGGRKVADTVPNGGGAGPVPEIQQANPASLQAMLTVAAEALPKAAAGGDPVKSVAQLLGVGQLVGAEPDPLYAGLEPMSVSSFVEAITRMSTTNGHTIYPQMMVSEGTTSIQWGANWLSARME